MCVWGGGGGKGRWGRSSRPLDKGGGGGLPKKCFQPFEPQFGLIVVCPKMVFKVRTVIELTSY